MLLQPTCKCSSGQKIWGGRFQVYSKTANHVDNLSKQTGMIAAKGQQEEATTNYFQLYGIRRGRKQLRPASVLFTME